MRKSHLLTLLLCVVLLGSCSDGTVHIVATSDIHGDYFSSGPCGGMSRVSSWLKSSGIARKNLVYVDLGDILSDSPASFYDRTSNFDGNTTTAMCLDYMDCSIAVPGNHDIETGVDFLNRFMYEFRRPAICANLVIPGSVDPYLQPYTIIKRKGHRIAFLGMVTTDVNEKVPSLILNGLSVRPIAESAANWVKYIRETERPDAVIGLFHAGKEETVAALKDIDGFDAVIFGHDHTRFDSACFINPGAGGNAISHIELSFRDKQPVFEMQNVCLDSMETDKKFDQFLKARKERIDQYMDSVAGSFDASVVVYDYLSGPTAYTGYVHALLQKMAATPYSFAFHASPSFDIEKGEVRIKDFFELFPYPNYISVLMLTPQEIRKILEYSVNLFYDNGKHLLVKEYNGNPSSRFLSFNGIDYTIDLSKPYGERVLLKTDIKDAIPVAVDNYLYNINHGVVMSALNISALEMRRRTVSDCGADVRYASIVHAANSFSSNRNIHIEANHNWSIIGK